MIQACLSTQICIKGNHYILSTGDKLTLYHRQRVNTFFPNSDLIEFFGTSEASFISYNFNNSAPSESVGKLFQSVKMNVDQPDELGIGVLKIQVNWLLVVMLKKGYVTILGLKQVTSLFMITMAIYTYAVENMTV